MIDFDASAIIIKHKVPFVELEYWLYNNVGAGGRWLDVHYRDGYKMEPMQGDEWGVYSSSIGRTIISIVDEQKAVLFALRWV